MCPPPQKHTRSSPPRVCLPAAGGLRLAIHFVVAGQAQAFRELEGWAEGRPVEEMPVNVSEVLARPGSRAA